MAKLGSLWIACALLAAPAQTGAQSGEWVDLFDGKSLSGWQVMPRKDQQGRWVIDEGSLKPEGKPGSLASEREFGDFELLVEWKIADNTNSGIFYRVPAGDEITGMAVEYQLADNLRKPSQEFPDRRNGAVYGLYAPELDASRPIGEWNETRILARGPLVQHWLNGTLVAEYEAGSQDWKRRLAESKFRNPDFGMAARGRIVLQDHGSAVWFRSVRARELD